METLSKNQNDSNPSDYCTKKLSSQKSKTQSDKSEKIWKFFSKNYFFFSSVSGASYFDYGKVSHKVGPEARFLEIGVGPGLAISNLNPKNYYTFTDMEDNFLKISQAKAQKHFDSTHYSFEKGRALDVLMQAKTNHYDVIVMMHVFTVVDHQEKIIDNAIKVLKKGGQVIIYTSLLTRILFLLPRLLRNFWWKSFGWRWVPMPTPKGVEISREILRQGIHFVEKYTYRKAKD